MDEPVSLEDFDAPTRKELRKLIAANKKRYKKAIETGIVDHRHPMEPTRRLWFEARVRDFKPEDYPEVVPRVFEEGACSVFGHICPVFFAAEAMTETEEERRIGRGHLSFKTMMRIVRRDDYRCQHCQKQLQDNEVEFDHIIPVSKGGSSEEHNLRLTCFDCNRDKSDDFTP